MADDPNREMLPTKEGSCIDTGRSSIDPRERHVVNKLDRYQLEDKYLRLLDEVHGLKKLSNSQEDKIKRLATKLMRASNNPRGCTTPLQISNDRDRIATLEMENAKLKDKTCVLRNQLLSHKVLTRSPTRCRREKTGTSSGATTYRSECGRTKTAPSCQCAIRNGNDDNDIQNYLVKIEELETQRKEMMSRITELESELAAHMAGNQREKVAENVEYIRIWRQMKQHNDKLIASQNVNEALNAQIRDLKKLLEDTTKNNREITSALVDEKQRLAEMDEQMTKAKDSQLTLREKDEQIRDLMNEMKILQQHNNELIALSSRYGEVEVENVELKRKISEQLTDNQTLKSAFNNEQANMAALQAANAQLLGKLQELQKNMDRLTIQLVSFQTQGEKHDRVASGTQTGVKLVDKTISASTLSDLPPRFYEECLGQNEVCRNCCEGQRKTVNTFAEILTPCQCCKCSIDHRVRPAVDTRDTTSQTEIIESLNYKVKETPVPPITKSSVNNQSPGILPNNRLEYDDGHPLSREKMLKLLEQAQINTPLEAQNAARIRQIDSTCAVACSGIYETSQRNPQRSADTQQSSLLSNATVATCTSIAEEWIGDCRQSTSSIEKVTFEPSQILMILYEILKDYSKKMKKFDGADPAVDCHHNSINISPKNNTDIDTSTIIDTYANADVLKNENKAYTNNGERVHENDGARGRQNGQTGDELKKNANKSCAILYEKPKDDKSKQKSVSVEGEGIKARNHFNKFTETADCTCTPDQRCYMSTDCGYGCCTVPSGGGIVLLGKDNSEFGCDSGQKPIRNAIRDIGSTIQEAFDSIYMARVMLQKGGINYAGNNECFDLWRDMKTAGNPNDLPTMNKNLKTTSRELDKCRELLRVQYNLNGLYKKETSGVKTMIEGLGARLENVESTPDQLGNTEILRMTHISDMARQLESQKEQIAKLQRTIPNCEAACEPMNDCTDNSFSDLSSFPMLITTGQGLVEVHILCLQLSTSAAQILFKNNVCDISVFISWDIWGQETAFTPILRYPKLNFNSSSVYRIPELHKFFDCVLREHVMFQVHMVNRDESAYTVAKAKLCVKDILDYPQNKLHYITPVYSVMPCSSGVNFGQLSLWVRLSCDVDMVESFKDRRGLLSETMNGSYSKMKADVCKKGQSSYLKYPEDIEARSSNLLQPILEMGSVPEHLAPSKTYKNYEKPVGVGMEAVEHGNIASSESYVGSESLKLGRSQSSITATMDNEDDTPNESDDGQPNNDNDHSSSPGPSPERSQEPSPDSSAVQKTRLDSGDQIETASIIEFNSVLQKNTTVPLERIDSGIDDVSYVFAEDNWQEFKRSSQRSRNSDPVAKDLVAHDPVVEPDTITIEIKSMTLFQKTAFIADPDVHLLYIEFIFLGNRGADMETISLPKNKTKNESLVYNFSKKFLIDAETHATQRNMLSAMLSGDANANIRFVVVSEPTPEEMDTKECIEVGHADFNIRDYALGDGFKEVPLIIMNPEQTEQIGVLKISITGIETIRDCIMMPHRYSIMN